MEILIWILIGIVLIGGPLLCFWIIGEAETAVSVFLGKPIAVHQSGPCLKVPRVLGKMVRFPTTQFELEYDITQAITQRSFYYPEKREIVALEERIEKITEEMKEEKKPAILEEKKRQLDETREELDKAKKKLDEAKEKKEELAEFDEAVEIPKIGCTIYLRYSTDKSLIDTLKVLGGPKDREGLQAHYGGVVVGCFRDIAGTIPWRAVIENREYIVREMQKRFIEAGSPFMVAGFKAENIYVAMTVVDLPDALTNLLNLPQQENLKAMAAKKVAQRLRAEIGEGIGEAAKTLEKDYGFPTEKAQDAAIERHGDVLAAREGEFRRIQWMSKGEGSGSGGINPATIAQIVTVAQEMLKKPSEKPKPAEQGPAEPEKEPEKEEEDPRKEVEKLLSQKVLSPQDSKKLGENLKKLSKKERRGKLSEIFEKIIKKEVMIEKK